MKKIFLFILFGLGFVNFSFGEIICIDQETETYVDCPVACEVETGDNLTGENRSALYVNDIQHASAGIINISIPAEISWDYTNENDEFNLVVSGYNVDTEYIEKLLAIETYHPSSEDFTQSFTGTITLLMPYIIIVLFILFIWRLIKRIFK